MEIKFNKIDDTTFSRFSLTTKHRPSDPHGETDKTASTTLFVPLTLLVGGVLIARSIVFLIPSISQSLFLSDKVIDPLFSRTVSTMSNQRNFAKSKSTSRPQDNGGKSGNNPRRNDADSRKQSGQHPTTAKAANKGPKKPFQQQVFYKPGSLMDDLAPRDALLSAPTPAIPPPYEPPISLCDLLSARKPEASDPDALSVKIDDLILLSPAYNVIIMEAVVTRLIRAGYDIDDTVLKDSTSAASQALVKTSRDKENSKTTGAITSSNTRTSIILNLTQHAQGEGAAPGDYTQSTTRRVLPLSRTFTIVAAVTSNFQAQMVTFTATLLYPKFQENMLRRNISTACDGQPNWHPLLIWSLLHASMDFALPTLALDINTLLKHLLSGEQMISLRARLILTVTDTHIDESTAHTDKCRGRGIVMYVFSSPDKAEHGIINDMIKRHFLGSEQQAKQFNIGGLRGMALTPLSSQQPHSFHSRHLPYSLVSKPAYFLLRVKGIPLPILLNHLLVMAVSIVLLEGVVGIINEFVDTNDQALSFDERDAPSKVIIFSCPDDLLNAHNLRHQLANVVDKIWIMRLNLESGNNYYDDLPTEALVGHPNTPSIGLSRIVFSSPNFDAGSEFPSLKAQYHYGEVLVPIIVNVDLRFLYIQCQTPQNQWAGQAKPPLTAAQRQTFCGALSTMIGVCSMDTSATTMDQLTATLTSSFLNHTFHPVPRGALVHWLTEVVLWLQDSNEENSSTDEPSALSTAGSEKMATDGMNSDTKRSDFHGVDGGDTRMEQQFS